MYYQDKTLENKIHGAKFLAWDRINKSTICISTDRGDIRVSVEGDCCSHSIFYDVVVPEECYGAEITGFDTQDRESKVPTEEQVNEKAIKLCGEDHWYSECLSIWDVKFHTINGTIYLRHVNSSNGYYDGTLDILCNY
jgi:hypothetical protein